MDESEESLDFRDRFLCFFSLCDLVFFSLTDFFLLLCLWSDFSCKLVRSTVG